MTGRARGVVMVACALLVVAVLSPVPAPAAPVAVDIPAFATQVVGTEEKTPNFWGPPVEPARQERYAEAPNGVRDVQYFEKARMERGPDGVTNGLLTLELITGQRQFGDARFAAFAPSTLPVVGDTDNTWPTYAALNARVFPEQAAQSDERVTLIYRQDGTFTHDAKLGAKPGAAAGGYVRDAGGRFAHNVPAAFWSYLNALPGRWEAAMGYPLTEAFWAQVRVRGAKTWVLIQPFERRVLSYTPDNDPNFAVEMGNIGSHYWLWRYRIAPDEGGTPVARAVGTGKAGSAVSASSAATGSDATTPPGVPAIRALRLGLVTDSTAALSFETDLPATTRLVYGTASHAYQWSQEVSTAEAQDHRVTVTGLAPKTKYYFVLRATGADGTGESRESYFATAPPGSTQTAEPAAKSGIAATDDDPDATATRRPATATATPKATGTPKPAPTATPEPGTANTQPTNTPRPATETPTPRIGATEAPQATPTAPREPTNTPTPRPATATATPVPTVTPRPTATPEPEQYMQMQVTRVTLYNLDSSSDSVQRDNIVLAVTLTEEGGASKSATLRPGGWSQPSFTQLVSAEASPAISVRVRGRPVTVRIEVRAPTATTTYTAVFAPQVTASEYQGGKTYKPVSKFNGASARAEVEFAIALTS